MKGNEIEYENKMKHKIGKHLKIRTKFKKMPWKMEMFIQDRILFKFALSADFLQNLSEKRASRNYKTQLFFSECARRSG